MPIESESAEIADLPPILPAPDGWPKREDTREFDAIPVDADEPQAAVALPALPPLTGDAPDEDDGPWAGRDFAWG